MLRWNPRLIRTFMTLCVAIVALCLYEVIDYFDSVRLPTAEVPATLYGSPSNTDLEKSIVEAISQAKHSVFLAIFAITDQKVIDALRQKAQEGVEVFVVCDYKASADAHRRLGNAVHVIKRRSKGLMHLKVMVIDGIQTWIGSANMTGESLRLHSNLITAIHSEPLAEMAQAKIISYASDDFQPFIRRTFPLKDQKVQLWFLPDNRDAYQRIFSLIDNAQSTLKIAMFTWTRTDFAKAVIAAHQRGVAVEVIIDRNSSDGASSEVADLLSKAGIVVLYNTGQGLLHDKFMWVDGKILVNGSANWTKAAFDQNDDCFIVLEPLTSEQQNSMEELWQRMKNQGKKYR